MRIPKAIQRAETGGGSGFIHRGITHDLWESPCELARVGRQFAAEFGIEERGRAWAAAMMDQARDRLDAKRVHTGQSRFSPVPAGRTGVRCDLFPQERR